MGGERKGLWLVLILPGVLIGLAVLGMVVAYLGLWERIFR
jgi:hypothetical protein